MVLTTSYKQIITRRIGLVGILLLLMNIYISIQYLISRQFLRVAPL